VNDLGRRYFLVTGTPGGKKRTGQTMLLVGGLLNIVGLALEANPSYHHVWHELSGFGGALILAGVVYLFIYRKAP
jgi:hypothetical protein